MTGSGPGPRRPNIRQLSAGALITAALAILFNFLAGPSSPPATPGPGPVSQFSNSDAPTTAKPDAPAPQGSPPLHISYPGVGMDQDVLPLTPAQGTQTSIVPPMTIDAYWLTPYGSPGSSDTTYLIGHSWEGRDSSFNHLSTQAHPGDHLTVTTATGPANYTVKTVSTENKNTLKDSPIWNKVPNRLILVSCYTADLWGTNIIITADQTPTPNR